MEVNIENSWKNELQQEFGKKYFIKLTSFIKQEYKKKEIFPKPGLIFNAFNYCSFTDLKVVIIGQDPYHGYNQAHGLSFSVPDGVRIPPSLQNIFKEIYFDLKIKTRNSGNLLRWAQQGVLLLNSILTVEKNKPASHSGIGWEVFTDSIINIISTKKKNVVFLLWGAYSHKKGLQIERNKHLVIETSHPSPFSADKGFFGSNPFSKCNDYLIFHDKAPINWI